MNVQEQNETSPYISDYTNKYVKFALVETVNSNIYIYFYLSMGGL